MRDLNRNLNAVLTLLLTGASAFGQQGYTNPDPLHLQCAIDWINNTRDSIYHQETESQCVGGTWHNLTYIYTFGNKGQVPLMDVDTGKPCSCPVSGSDVRVGMTAELSSAGQKPRQEDNCDSGAPYDNSAADAEDLDDLLDLLAGSSGPDPFAIAAARPAIAPLGAHLTPRNAASRNAASRSAARAVTAAPRAATPGSFPLTLPYRALPAAPLLLGTLPNVNAVCLSSVNPTHFETAHVDSQVLRFNTCTGATIATIQVASLPLQVRVTPDGTQAIVTHFSSAISFIDTANNTVSGVLQTPSNFTPSGLAISPDGSYALITNLEPAGAGGAAIGVVDIASRTMSSTIPLDTDYPQSVFINPDATLAWVVYPFNNSVEAIDLLTGAVVSNFNFNGPISVAFNATGTVVYVAEGSGVDVIDAKTYAITTTVLTGSIPTDLLVTPDGAYVVVNNNGGMSVSVIDTQSLTATTLAVSGIPHGNVVVPVQ